MTEGVHSHTEHAPSVVLPEFTGPLDLLLHLIKKNEVSIYDIPLALICDQYHDHLQTMQELDLDVAGEFLWMASWLMQLKSKLLLPQHRREEPDPRLELVERLEQYQRVKELASLLHDSDIVRRCVWQGTVTTQLSTQENELDWEDVDLLSLAATYLNTMQRFAASHPPPLPLLPLRFRVEDKMKELYEQVKLDGLFPLLRHLDAHADAEEIVTLIVATLELVRLGGVKAEQRLPFAEIFLRPGARLLDPDALLSPEESYG